MRLVRMTACVMTVSTLMAAGCANESDDGSFHAQDAAIDTDTGDERSEADRRADQTAAEAALLTLADFPAGWEAVPESDSGTDGEMLDDLAQCLNIDVAELDKNNPRATSDTFTSPDDDEVSSEVTFTPSTEDAARSLEILEDDAAPACYAEAIKATIARNMLATGGMPEGVEVGEPSFNRLSFDRLGDASTAFRTTIPVAVDSLNVDVYIDFVLVRVGRVGVETTFMSQFSPFETDEAERLTQVVIDRVNEGEAD